MSICGRCNHEARDHSGLSPYECTVEGTNGTMCGCDGYAFQTTGVAPRKEPDVAGRVAKLHDDEPVFLIRAQDILAPQAIALYAELARKVGLDDLAQSVEARAVQVMQWQARHAKLVKSPD